MRDPGDVEQLAQVGEWFSRMAETIERVTEKMADSIAQTRAEQAELRDELLALSNRVESTTRLALDLQERMPK
jgi:ABC-type transporter Mla subunit MlaD